MMRPAASSASRMIWRARVVAPTTSCSMIFWLSSRGTGLLRGCEGGGPAVLGLTIFAKVVRCYSIPPFMGKVVILGCGYAGKTLARLLVANGEAVRATTTTESKIVALRSLGTEAAVLDPKRIETYAGALEEARAVVHLAPPPAREKIDDEVERIVRSLGPKLEAYVYGSTTGVFGNQDDTWVDEATP